MPFDDSTRGRVQTFVGASRDLLAEEFAWQLQQTYGMDPTSGEVAGLDRLGELDDQRLETARNHGALFRSPGQPVSPGSPACAGPHRAGAGLYRPEPAGRAAPDGSARHPAGERCTRLSVQGLPALPACRRIGAGGDGGCLSGLPVQLVRYVRGQLLRTDGRLGAITSRTCFFLSSFQKWREDILLVNAPPVVVADLGFGVMDEAMVEAAAYILQVKR